MLNRIKLSCDGKEVADYIEHMRGEVNFEYGHEYHFQPKVGWINDPNGFSYYKGKYHLFYQYFPYDARWGLMYWGHATSNDLVTWQHEDIALYPDQEYDYMGCFSGTAIVDGDAHILMYTGIMPSGVCINDETVREEIRPEKMLQVQCIAKEEDGTYVKSEMNPVIGPEDLPSFVSDEDFRDPKVIKKDGMYYCFVGAKTPRENPSDVPEGLIVSFVSNDMMNWRFLGTVMKSDDRNDGVLECPDFFELDGEEVFLYSEQFKGSDGYLYHNMHSCLYKTGKMDFEEGAFVESFKTEIDLGLDFYAPQTILDTKGRRIMIAWMQMWDRNIPTHDLNHGWAGSMTFPRELHMRNGRLYQLPVNEIKEYYLDEVVVSNEFEGEFIHPEVRGKSVDLDIEFEVGSSKSFGVKIFMGDGEETVLSYDVQEGLITFDRTNSLHLIGNRTSPDKPDGIRRASVLPVEGILKLRILLDNCSAEVFVNEGEIAMSHKVFSGTESDGIVLFSEGKVKVDMIKHAVEK